MKKIVAIIQARMGSTRLPEKVLKDLMGKPMIWHIVERAKQAKTLEQVVVATSIDDDDTPLYQYLVDNGIPCIRGSNDDVLARYFQSASEVQADVIVRLTGDNPLIDFKMLDNTVEYFLQSNLPYVATVDVPSIAKPIPLGVGCEVFSFEILKEAFLHANQEYEREHVTPYMYQKNVDRNNVLPSQYSYRITVDTSEDFECIRRIYELLYNGVHDFCTDEVIQCMESDPKIAAINSSIVQKKLGE